MKQWFSMQWTSARWSLSPWERPNKQGNPCNCFMLELWGCFNGGRRSQAEPSECPRLRRKCWQFRRRRFPEFAGQNIRQERSVERKNSEELQKVSTEYSEESWSVDSSEQTTRGPEKKFLEEFEETVPGTHVGPEKAPVSTCQTG